MNLAQFKLKERKESRPSVVSTTGWQRSPGDRIETAARNDWCEQDTSFHVLSQRSTDFDKLAKAIFDAWSKVNTENLFDPVWVLDDSYSNFTDLSYYGQKDNSSSGQANNEIKNAPFEIIRRIQETAKKSKPLLDAGADATLKRALSDALTFAALLPADAPVANISTAEDGEIIIEWRIKDRHAVVSFDGDGMFGYAMLIGDSYKPGSKEAKLGDGTIPSDLADYLGIKDL
jgi:hypothetical protein